MPLVSQVFGVSAKVNNYSYVDRDNLDKKLRRLLNRQTHIAIKGPSKCGKSWLRQKCMDDAIIVQCRLDMTPEDIYSQALSSLGVPFNQQRSSSTTLSANAAGTGSVQLPLIGKLGMEGELSASHEHSSGVSLDFSTSTDNLQFVADSIIRSGKRLVVEDFHYLSSGVRDKLAHDLKTLWDYGCFIVIIGVWTQANLLTYLNPDLTGRIEEISVSWTNTELGKVIDSGCAVLNVEIDSTIRKDLILDSFGNVGILQSLLLKLIEDEADISQTAPTHLIIADPELFDRAAKSYANQLDGLYQQFAKTLSVGIRRRRKSTGIYALAMQAIVNASNEQLLNGYSRADIFSYTNAIEHRIKKGNLKTVLQKLVELQNPGSGRTLVISYDEAIDAVFAVDLQLLFYRKYHSMGWPWEEMAEEARQQSLFEAEETD